MDLTTKFLSIEFENPFVLASAPPTAKYDMMARAFDAGWAGAVVKTLIKEPVNNLHNRFASNKIGSRIISFENIELLSERTPDEWYEDIRKLKQNYPNKVVIGSIMGDAKEPTNWLELAIGCQQAGVDLLELNFSCPHGYPERGKGAAIGQSAEYSGKIVEWLKAEPSVKIPLIPKLTAAVADISYIGEAVAGAGADGICAINTIPSLMGFDLKTLKPKASVAGYTTAGGYSGAGIKPIALKCISNLVKRPGLPVMGGGGICNGYDAAEFILLGATVVQVCTTVMLEGYDIVRNMKKELTEFMSWHNFEKIEDFLGLGNKKIIKYSELDLNYKVIAYIDPDKCKGCGKCYISCQDGGYQAIEMKDKISIIDKNKCSGCSLCFQVCPSNAVSMIEK
ncbi:MAG: NAD-dependent dihydropyrimidine dehydrogenase subunit PreA [Ignavibacteriales bacterium]|nr:NAD-dependent dihydropyrimidine dehydrogenase subunit PreA [Ignavibacteriales bacterium]